MEQLQTLLEIYQSGFISKEEYEQRKTQIIDKLTNTKANKDDSTSNTNTQLVQKPNFVDNSEDQFQGDNFMKNSEFDIEKNSLSKDFKEEKKRLAKLITSLDAANLHKIILFIISCAPYLVKVSNNSSSLNSKSSSSTFNQYSLEDEELPSNFLSHDTPTSDPSTDIAANPPSYSFDLNDFDENLINRLSMFVHELCGISRKDAGTMENFNTCTEIQSKEECTETSSKGNNSKKRNSEIESKGNEEFTDNSAIFLQPVLKCRKLQNNFPTSDCDIYDSKSEVLQQRESNCAIHDAENIVMEADGQPDSNLPSPAPGTIQDELSALDLLRQSGDLSGVMNSISDIGNFFCSDRKEETQLTVSNHDTVGFASVNQDYISNPLSSPTLQDEMNLLSMETENPLAIAPAFISTPPLPSFYSSPLLTTSFRDDLRTNESNTFSELNQVNILNSWKMEESNPIENTISNNNKTENEQQSGETGNANPQGESKKIRIKIQIYRVEKSADPVNASKPWMCDAPGCTKRFTDSSNLIKHLRVHTGEKPYDCPTCGKSFSHNSSLKEHLNTHTGDKPFLCSECGQGFAQSANLKRHFRVHSGEKPFQCSECGRGFTQSTNLKQHEQRVHGMGKQNNKSPND